MYSAMSHTPPSFWQRLHSAHSQLTFSLGASFYAWMTWQKTWRTHCADMADHFQPQTAGQTLQVLDLGIGPGVSGISILDRRPDVRVVGLDFSSGMLRRARHYLQLAGADIPLLRADVMQLPLCDASFDVLTHHSFLYLLSDRERALSEMFRVLRPGGRYVILEPNRAGRIWTVPRMRGGFRFKLSMFLWRLWSGGYGQFSKPELTQLLARHGFIDISVTETLDGLGLLATASRPR